MITDESANTTSKIEGRNPVMEALNSGRSIDKILVQSGEKNGSIRKIIALARERKIVVTETERQRLDRLSDTKSHQGVIAFAAAKEYSTISEILSYAESRGEAPFVIICDELNDPHNLGSIIRTANAMGAHGVIIPKRNSVGLSPVVDKSSAGALEFTRVARVANLASAIETLKKENIWIVAADMDGDRTIYSHDFSGAVGIVVGSEGKGVSRLVKEKCDFVVNIPMFGDINSLNASVAAALMIYEVARSRNSK
ncbi:MAG: 23S rRNA (guanosine(2251)-2'-O)-methyltransferase RlmB [Clostridia bacterium]|nr:23S rRNA (guanosine(2251)-2'-O)-methyltransferase RlmB [Clostridia bacterium]